MKTDRVQYLLLERYRLGEISESERQSVEHKLSELPEWRKALDEIEAFDAEFARDYPAEKMLAEIVKLEKKRKNRFRRAVAFFAPMAAVFLFGIFLFIPSYRTKGLTPSLTVYQKTGRVLRLTDGHTNVQGDVLQIAYIAGGRKYGMIFSIDGNGAVNYHLPVGKAYPVKLKARGEHVLPQAYQLDDAPDFERFFFLSSDHPFSGAKVRLRVRKAMETSNLQALTKIPLDDSVFQTTFTLIKGRK